MLRVNRQTTVVLLAIAAGVVGILVLRVLAPAVRARSTESGLARRVAPLLQDIARRPLSVSVQRLSSENALAAWCIAGLDQRDLPVAWATIDAKTRRIEAVETVNDESAAANLPEIGRDEAIRLAWAWLRRVGIAAQANRWAVARSLRLGPSQWWVWWQGDTRAAAVSVHARSGEFVSARAWDHMPAPPVREVVASAPKPVPATGARPSAGRPVVGGNLIPDV